MSQEDLSRVLEVFREIIELPETLWGSTLEKRCGSDVEIRKRVETLLRHDAKGWDVFDRPVFDRFSQEGLPFPFLEERSTEPAQLGRYRLVERIGEGAMGTVFRAEQQDPRRDVAIKVLRYARLDHHGALRLKRESRILARLRHSSIAQIIEVGLDGSGGGSRPYIVMEYVVGETLRAMITRDGFNIRQRVSVIINICDAVEYAHKQGVIHRDLKPENIVVENLAGQLRCKVLDFGIARLTEQDIDNPTLITEVGQLLGTLPYMSPEQLCGESDARSDVYAVGVILYELLTRRRPFDVAGRAIPQIIKEIENSIPGRPSSFDRELAGDLEEITLKAIARDKAARYQSLAELAADLKRHLNNRPVLARKPSVFYVVGKFARRRRGVFVASCVATVAIILGGATGWYGFYRANESLEQLTDLSGYFAVDIASSLDSISGTFEVRKKLLSRIRDQIESLLRQRPGDPGLLAAYADVLQQQGNIERDEGRRDDALALRHKAIEIRRVLCERLPENCEQRAKLAIDHVLIGDLHRGEPGHLTSRERYEEALGIQERLIPVRPNDLGLLDDLGWSYERLAFLAVQTYRLDAAEALIRSRLDVCRRLQTLEPDVSRTLEAFRSGYWMKGDLETVEGRLADAYGSYQQAFAYAKKLYESNRNHRIHAQYYAGAALKMACPPDDVQPLRPLTEFLAIAESITEDFERKDPSSVTAAELRREVEFHRFLVAMRIKDYDLCHRAVEALLPLVRATYHILPDQDGATAYESALTYGIQLARAEADEVAIKLYEDELFELYSGRAISPYGTPRDKARYATALAKRDRRGELASEVALWARRAVQEIGTADPTVIYSAAAAVELTGKVEESRALFMKALSQVTSHSALGREIQSRLRRSPFSIRVLQPEPRN